MRFHSRPVRMAWIACLGLGIAVAGCVPSPPAPAPAPTPAPAPRPAPAPTPTPTTAYRNWNDAPVTPGDWVYSATATGGTATFGPRGQEARLVLRCDRAGQAVELVRPDVATAPSSFRILTQTEERTIEARPGGIEPPALVARLQPRDRLLDAMAFTRGRFAVETPGQATLYVPAWPEVMRVIEDCR